MSTLSHAGRVAIVTGAGRSLGRAYAVALAARGARVVVNDIGGADDPEGAWADRVVEQIAAAGGEAVASDHSVMTPEGGQGITDLALSTFGRIDIVVNNAGFLRPGYFGDLTLAQIQDTIDVHLLAAFYVTQPAWQHMLGQEFGRVVLTSSGAVFGLEACTNYISGKSAQFGLTAALGLEGHEHNIRVNAVLPSAPSRIGLDNPNVGADADTFRQAFQALGDRRSADSVAALVLYLTSDQCAVSGHSYSSMGGRYARCFIGVTEGWLSDTPEPSAEDIGDHIADIDALTGISAPESMLEEIIEVRERIATRGDNDPSA